MASAGYPGSYVKGKPIYGLVEAARAAQHQYLPRWNRPGWR